MLFGTFPVGLLGFLSKKRLSLHGIFCKRTFFIYNAKKRVIY